MPDTQDQVPSEEQREWRNAMLELLQDNGTNSELLPGCLDWGIAWYMECSRMSMEQFGDSKGTKEDLKQVFEDSYLATVAMANIPRYPSGMPSLRAIILAQEVFVACFGPEADQAREIVALPSPRLATH